MQLLTQMARVLCQLELPIRCQLELLLAISVTANKFDSHSSAIQQLGQPGVQAAWRQGTSSLQELQDNTRRNYNTGRHSH